MYREPMYCEAMCFGVGNAEETNQGEKSEWNTIQSDFYSSLQRNNYQACGEQNESLSILEALWREEGGVLGVYIYIYIYKYKSRNLNTRQES